MGGFGFNHVFVFTVPSIRRPMDFLTRLQAIEKKIQENLALKAKLEERKDNLEKEYKKLVSELEAEGVTAEEITQTLKNIDAELEEVISEKEQILK
jgi:DNA repair exonuclease SbcCD ATPase subunit